MNEAAPAGRDRLLAPLVVAIALALFAWRCADLAGWFVEDAYINFRYAENLARGHGVVWNVGGERVEGYTSPLHLALLAGSLLCGAGMPAVALAIGTLSAASLAAVFWVVVRRETGRLAPLAAAVLALYLVDGQFVVHAIAGLETVLYMLLLALDFLVAIRFVEKPGRGRALALAGINVLSLLGRPDAAPYIAAQAAVLFVWALHRRRTDPADRPLTSTLVSYGAAGLLGAAYLGAKYAYFGYVLPNPYYIKANDLGALWGKDYVLDYVKFLARLLLFAPALLLCDRARLREWWRRPGSKAKTALLLVPPLVFTAWYTTVVHEVAYCQRFEYPTYFFFALATGLAISIGNPLERAAAWIAPRLRVPVAVILWATPLLAVGVALRVTRLSFPWFELVESKYYRPIGMALRDTGLGPKASLVFDSAGVVPYLSGFTHIDPVGLTDNVLCGRKPIGPYEREAYIFGRDPDVYIGPETPATAGATGPLDDPAMQTGYVRKVLLAPDRYTILKGYLKAYGGLSMAERAEVLHHRMRELRDRWDYLGEIPYPVPWPPGHTTFAYVRRASPHRDELVRGLETLFESGRAFRRPPSMLAPGEEGGR